MIARGLESTIRQSLQSFPVVGLIGARQAGKTTLAKAIAGGPGGEAVYLDLERPSDLAKLSEGELYLEQHAGSLVILDEIQRKPELFPLLRALVDAASRNGRFLVLGSASPDLLRQSSETLAGRIIYHELTPFTLGETANVDGDFHVLWWRGGYPRSFLAGGDEQSCLWREAFIQTHVERDVPNLGIRIEPARLRLFWQMLAHCHAQPWNASKVAASLGLSVPTIQRYLDVLQDTFMVRRLQPYHPNLKKRLVKSPKVYVRDSGLLHALLHIRDHATLLGHPSAGASWEGWLIEQVLAIVPRDWEASFYQTSGGAEVDLLLHRPGGAAPLAVEMKHTLAPRPTRGLRSALADLDNPAAFIVYPGTEFYPLDENIRALPAQQLHRLFE